MAGLQLPRRLRRQRHRAELTYYFYPNTNCTVATCQLSVGFVSSMDGGAGWSLPHTVAGPMSLADIASTTQGVMVGDYISTSFSGANAVPVFAVAKPKAGSVFNEAMYSTAMPVTAQQAYPLRVVEDEPVLVVPGSGALRGRPLVTP